MKATGIVRRIDDLGRVVIPKEIRRTMRIREGDPLEIYTTREGEVIFKKYSLIGGLEDFAAQFCDVLNRSSGFTAAVTDRDAIIAITGSGKRELLGKPLSDALAQVMEQRSIYQYQGSGRPLPVSDSSDRYTVAVAAPILCEGDVLGLVLFLSSDAQIPGEGEYKLAQTVSAFWGGIWRRKQQCRRQPPPALFFLVLLAQLIADQLRQGFHSLLGVGTVGDKGDGGALHDAQGKNAQQTLGIHPALILSTQMPLLNSLAFWMK